MKISDHYPDPFGNNNVVDNSPSSVTITAPLIVT
jgi:hypothetical protein